MKKVVLIMVLIFYPLFLHAEDTPPSGSTSTESASTDSNTATGTDSSSGTGTTADSTTNTDSMATAASTNGTEQDRTELKTILTDIEAAINAADFDALFKHFDDKITISFLTTEVATGKKDIMAFYNKMFNDPGAPLESLQTKASLGAPAIFHGDTITAYGRAQDTYKLKSGTTHVFDTGWTASAIKRNGQWKVISITFSVNPLNNPILSEMSGKMGFFVTIAFILGILVTIIIARVSRKK